MTFKKMKISKKNYNQEIAQIETDKKNPNKYSTNNGIQIKRSVLSRQRDIWIKINC